MKYKCVAKTKENFRSVFDSKDDIQTVYSLYSCAEESVGKYFMSQDVEVGDEFVGEEVPHPDFSRFINVFAKT